jgi:hypothetical protein
MLGKAMPSHEAKIGDRVDELVGNIQKKRYGREGSERVRGKIGEELAYILDLRFNIDACWLHGEGEVLGRPTHAMLGVWRLARRLTHAGFSGRHGSTR